ncbi:MAG: glycosyltransferase [Rhodospirillaceae bacterium]|nr:glycosyltransferase [Rhodospirillaceae bacterium]
MNARRDLLQEYDDGRVVPYPGRTLGRSHVLSAQQREPKTCSVVVVSYKTGPILLECLGSVLEQTNVTQLILVDNGNSRTMVQSLNALADENPQLEIITGHGNVGFSRGCNIGARRARGEYLLLLNPDTLIGENTLENALNVFDEHPGASMITVRLENPDGSEQRGGRRNLMTPWTCLVEQFRLDRLAPNHPHFKRLNLNETLPFTEVTKVQCISGAFMLMPKTTFDNLGGMDEEYFLHVEDVDFCMRIEKSSGFILYVPHVSVVHQQGTSRVYSGFVEWHKSKSFVKYFFKHFQPQYPKPLLNIFAAAIYTRFVLRLFPMTMRWIFDRVFSPKTQTMIRAPASSPARDHAIRSS